MRDLTASEKNLITYFETVIVDYGGSVESIRMNEADQVDTEALKKLGLVKVFERLPGRMLGGARKRSHYVELSVEGFAAAHSARNERSKRSRDRLLEQIDEASPDWLERRGVER